MGFRIFGAMAMSALFLSSCCTNGAPHIDSLVMHRCVHPAAEVLSQMGYPAEQVIAVNRCANFTGGLGLKTNYSANMSGCINENKTLDPEARKKLLETIDDARKSVSQLSLDAWNRCIVDHLGGKPKVIVIDSMLRELVYDKTTRDAGGTNADDIARALNGLNIILDTERVYPAWSLITHVRARSPQLVIMHLSSFYEKSAPDDPKEHIFKVIDFLRDGDKSVKFLIYTRAPSEDMAPERVSVYEQVKKRLAEYPGVDLWVVPGGHDEASFLDMKTQFELIKHVELLLAPMR